MQQENHEERQDGQCQRGMVIAHAEAEEEHHPDKGILPIRSSDPDVADQEERHHQAEMQCVETFSHNGMRPDGVHPGSSERE